MDLFGGAKKKRGAAARATSARGAIPATLRGDHVLGVAETGSGKTAAFAPDPRRALRDPSGVFALCVAPSRELAAQLADQFAVFGARQRVRVACVTGGVDGVAQGLELAAAAAARRRRHARRLAEVCERCEVAATLRCAAFLVLDEADRLLSPSLGPTSAASALRSAARGWRPAARPALQRDAVRGARRARGGAGGDGRRRGLAVSVVTQRDLGWLAAVEARLGAKLPKSDRVAERDALALLAPVSRALAEANAARPFDAGDRGAAA
ncbi:helicase [Aureococcus anophagefferens]|nr:helicase [Aureococcus anophagefferens]